MSTSGLATLRAQLRHEVTTTLRNGEQLLLTLIIPVMLLVFFSVVDVLPTDTKDPVDFPLIAKVEARQGGEHD